MYSVWAVNLALLTLAIWLLILSFFLWKEHQFLRVLFPKSGERDIRNRLIEVINSINDFSKNQEQLAKHLRNLERDGLEHIQRVKLIRYNPYQETGGEHSFSLALLDGKMNGIVLTSLHSRAGTRVYTKPVVDGKSDIELSKEESEVLSKALND